MDYVNLWVDVDECTAGLHSCGVNADCVDTIGGYNCSCKPMFFESADGKTCIGLPYVSFIIIIITDYCTFRGDHTRDKQSRAVW